MGKNFVITFAGDTSLGDWYLSKPNVEKTRERLETDPDSFFEGVKPLLRNSDHLIINLETVLARDPQIFLEDKQYPNWDDPNRTINVLKNLGVTAASLANNHSMDFGPEVMQETRRVLLNAGIKPFGAGSDREEAMEPLRITLFGEQSQRNMYIFAGMRTNRRYREKYHFLARNQIPGINSMNTQRISAQIQMLKQKEPEAIIVVYPHWQGYDYQWVSQRKEIAAKCSQFIEAGADYIIGHGSHMADHIEALDEGLIIYSIGNFVFNSPGRYQKMSVPPFSSIVQMNVTENASEWTIETKVYPIETDNSNTDYRVRIPEAEMPQLFVHHFKQQNDHKPLDVLNDAPTGKSEKPALIPERQINEVIDFLAGYKIIDDLNFDEQENIARYIDELDEAHSVTDERFKEFYKTFMTSRHLKKRDSNNYHYFDRLKSIIQKEYISYPIMRQFAHRKLNMENALSFQSVIVEMLESRRLGMTVYGQWLDKKDVAYRFADELGLRRPKTDNRLYSFHELKPQSGPAVLKPTASTGSMGVYLIFDPQRIFSVRDGHYLSSWEDLVQDVENKMTQDSRRVRQYLKKDEWMIEELILGSEEVGLLAPDLKFYTFYGEIMLVLEAIREGGDRYQFWNVENQKIFTGKYEEDHKIFKEATGFDKVCLDEIKRISLEIPVPFMRIDMLKGKDELVFGEATYYPGNYQDFNREWDRKLGEAYLRAENRIIDDLMNGKQFEAFKKIFIKPDSTQNVQASKIIVEGRVQGVGYRKWIKKQADKLNIRGYCQNRANGAVEIVAAGSMQQNLDAFIKKCQKGPSKARIMDVSIEKWAEPVGEEFEIKRETK